MWKKEQLIDRVAEIKEGTKKDATESVDAVFQAIEEAIASGEGLNLMNLLKIEVRDVPAKEATTARNPATGEMVPVAAKPATKKAVPKLGKKLRDAATRSV